MDPITIITILSGFAGIIGLLYLLFVGQRSIPEWWRDFKKNRLEKAEKKDEEEKFLPYKQYVNITRKFWKFPEQAYLDILCSEIPEEERHYFANPKDRNYLRYAKFADLDSLIYIRAGIAQVFPQLHVRDFSPSEYYDTHTEGLIVIGGPAWNPKYGEFQTQLPFHFISKPVGEDEILIIETLKGCAFKPTWDKNKELIKDISIFARIHIEKEIPVYLIAGCLTHGVLGAAKCFLDRKLGPSNINHIERWANGDDFVSVFETFKVGGFVATPDLSAKEPLVVLRKKGLNFDVVVANTVGYQKVR